VDVVYCYPAPGDTADTDLELLVAFNQVDRDPATGKPFRRQQLVARELKLQAQARDEGRGEPYRLVFAEGPGEVRTWAPGSKDDDGAASAAPPPRQPGRPGNANPPPPESEMKLTVVTFSGRMTAKDKGRVYQEATFHGSTEVIHVPTDNPDLEVKRHQLPPRAVLLTCREKLVVWTHRPANEPPQQFMHAYGDAYLRNEDYDGWGDVIKNEGKKIVFEGVGSVPARIKSRSGGTDQPGKTIIYDRATGFFEVKDSLGGTFTVPPRPAPKK
jgi:hypothetical protein